jgi:hypothetical protein
MNWQCYNEGYNSSVLYDSDTSKGFNPYINGSIEWKSWNQGWNAHYDPAWEARR